MNDSSTDWLIDLGDWKMTAMLNVILTEYLLKNVNECQYNQEYNEYKK